MFILVDDGSLDTVLRCDTCGEIRRYNLVESGFETYEEFVEDCRENAIYEHDEENCYVGAEFDEMDEILKNSR